MLNFAMYITQVRKLGDEINFWKHKYSYYKKLEELLEIESEIEEAKEQAGNAYKKTEELTNKLKYLNNNLEVSHENC